MSAARMILASAAGLTPDCGDDRVTTVCRMPGRAPELVLDFVNGEMAGGGIGDAVRIRLGRERRRRQADATRRSGKLAAVRQLEGSAEAFCCFRTLLTYVHGVNSGRWCRAAILPSDHAAFAPVCRRKASSRLFGRIRGTRTASTISGDCRNGL